MRESQILHENAAAWVAKDKRGYVVYRKTTTHSFSDSEYLLTPDGLSLALTRCDYLATRALGLPALPARQ